MILRDDKLKISGEEKDVEQAVHVLIQLFAVAARGTAIDEQKVDYTIAMSKDHPQETQENIAELDRDIIVIRSTANRSNQKHTDRKHM